MERLITENRIPFYRLSPPTLVDLTELREHMRLIAEGKPTPDDEGTYDE